MKGGEGQGDGEVIFMEKKMRRKETMQGESWGYVACLHSSSASHAGKIAEHFLAAWLNEGEKRGKKCTESEKLSFLFESQQCTHTASPMHKRISSMLCHAFDYEIFKWSHTEDFAGPQWQWGKNPRGFHAPHIYQKGFTKKLTVIARSSTAIPRRILAMHLNYEREILAFTAIFEE